MAIRCLIVLLVTAIFAAPTLAQPGAPDYTGEVCFDGSTVTVSVTATPTATAVLIYPNPPGGGYFMTNDGAGNYSASFSGLSAGASFSFHLVIQIPAQYEFPTHSFTLEPGCVSFGTDGGGGDGGDGGDGGIDPGGIGQGGLPHSRAFRHDVSESNGAWSVLLETGVPASPLPGVNSVALRYRIGDGPMQTESMSNLGNHIWGRVLPGVSAGDVVTYSFVETVGIEPVDTAWFKRTLGAAASPIPSEPISGPRESRANRMRLSGEGRAFNQVRPADIARCGRVRKFHCNFAIRQLKNLEISDIL